MPSILDWMIQRFFGTRRKKHQETTQRKVIISRIDISALQSRRPLFHAVELPLWINNTLSLLDGVSDAATGAARYGAYAADLYQAEPAPAGLDA